MGFKKDKEVKEEVVVKSGVLAKKDFKIVQNAFIREIKVGDDVSDLPEIYLRNLRAENVI